MNSFITPTETFTQQFYSLGQDIVFDLSHTGVKGINLSTLFLSYILDYGETIAEAQHFAYNRNLSFLDELALLKGGEKQLHYHHYHLITAFHNSFLQPSKLVSYFTPLFDDTVAVNPEAKLSRSQQFHERLLIVANDVAIESNFELHLTIAKHWQTFTSTEIAIFNPTIRISNIRLYYQPASPTSIPLQVFSIQHQFLTNTERIQSVQFHPQGGFAEHYLFALNNDVIQSSSRANFFHVPLSDQDSIVRTAVDLPLRFNQNPTTRKFDMFASTQKIERSQGREFIGAVQNSSYIHKLITYIRPDYLRILWSGSKTGVDYGALDLSVLPAVDTQHLMLQQKQIDVCERIASLYSDVTLSSVDLLMSHHYFTPIFGDYDHFTVSYSRPIRTARSNPNYIGDTAQDMLILLSIRSRSKL